MRSRMPHGLSRRSFLRGSAASTVGMGMIDAGSAAIAATAGGPPVLGPAAVPITLMVNGVARSLQVEPRTTLAEALRGPLGLTGTKIACDRGACSACTVWLDGVTVCSCMIAGRRGRRAPGHDDRGPGARRRPAPRAGGLHRARRDAVRLLHAGHGDELRRAAGAARRIRPQTRSRPRSAAISAAAAPIRMSSRRRWPRPPGARPDPPEPTSWPTTRRRAPRRSPSALRASGSPR